SACTASPRSAIGLAVARRPLARGGCDDGLRPATEPSRLGHGRPRLRRCPDNRWRQRCTPPEPIPALTDLASAVEDARPARRLEPAKRRRVARHLAAGKKPAEIARALHTTAGAVRKLTQRRVRLLVGAIL